MSDLTFEQQAVLISLKDMFKSGRHFSICTVDRALEALQIVPEPTAYAALRTLHCVSWADMPPEFRDQVACQTLKLFEGERMPCLEWTRKGEVALVKSGGFSIKRLLGKGASEA